MQQIILLLGLDCMLRPDMCGPNASCKETNKKVATQWKYHQCVCNPGFVGNGITCIDASDLANGDFFSLYILVVTLNHQVIFTKSWILFFWWDFVLWCF